MVIYLRGCCFNGVGRWGSGVVLEGEGTASFLMVLLQLQDSPAHPFGLRDLVLFTIVVQNFFHTVFHSGGDPAIFGTVGRPLLAANASPPFCLT